MRFGRSQCGDPLAIGTGQYVTSSREKRLFPSRVESLTTTAGFLLSMLFVISIKLYRTLHIVRLQFMLYPLSFMLSSLICSSQLATFVAYGFSVLA